jgi:hypothetical protein
VVWLLNCVPPRAPPFNLAKGRSAVIRGSAAFEILLVSHFLLSSFVSSLSWILCLERELDFVHFVLAPSLNRINGDDDALVLAYELVSLEATWLHEARG